MALRRMGKAGIKSSLPALLELFRDPQGTIRFQAGEAIAELGPQAKEAIPELVEMLRDASDANHPRRRPPRC